MANYRVAVYSLLLAFLPVGHEQDWQRDQPLIFGSWRASLVLPTPGVGKKRLRRPQSGSGFGAYPRTGYPRALRSGPYRLSLSPNNAGLPMFLLFLLFLPRRLDFLLALAKGYSLLGSQILESYSR